MFRSAIVILTVASCGCDPRGSSSGSSGGGSTPHNSSTTLKAPVPSPPVPDSPSAAAPVVPEFSE